MAPRPGQPWVIGGFAGRCRGLGAFGRIAEALGRAPFCNNPGGPGHPLPHSWLLGPRARSLAPWGHLPSHTGLGAAFHFFSRQPCSQLRLCCLSPRGCPEEMPCPGSKRNCRGFPCAFAAAGARAKCSSSSGSQGGPSLSEQVSHGVSAGLTSGPPARWHESHLRSWSLSQPGPWTYRAAPSLPQHRSPARAFSGILAGSPLQSWSVARHLGHGQLLGTCSDL